jgi:hypothetical protein
MDAGMRLKQVNRVRHRVHDGVQDLVAHPGNSRGEWRHAAFTKRATKDKIAQPYSATDLLRRAAPGANRVASLNAELPHRQRRFLDQSGEFRAIKDLSAIVSQLEMPVRTISRRKTRSTEAEPPANRHCASDPSRPIAVRATQATRIGDAGVSGENGQPFDVPLIELKWRQREAIREGLAAVETVVNSMPTLKSEPASPPTHTERLTNEPPGPASSGQNLHEYPNGKDSKTVTSLLDRLAHVLDRRSSSITKAQFTTIKHCLREIARQIDVRVARASGDGNDGCPSQLVRPREVDEKPVSDADFNPRLNSLGLDQPKSEALGAKRAAIKTVMNSTPSQRDQGETFAETFGKRTRIKSSSMKQLCTGASTKQLIARSSRQPEQFGPSADRVRFSSCRADVMSEKPKRSTLPTSVKATLTAVLVVAIMVVGTYFAGLRVLGLSVAAPVMAFFHETAIDLDDATGSLASAEAPRRTVAQETSLPLPDLYGVYAISDGQLIELEILPGQVPDPRVPMSALISRPSLTTLSTGRVQFIVYRRDMSTSISERVPIRVVARVRGAKRSAGEPRSADMHDAWTIRNISYDFRVSPMERNREMVLLRAADTDFTLPPGRYAMILKGSAYDFTIAGPMTDPAQCLERVEAADGTFYHECQQAKAEATALPLQDSPSSPRPIRRVQR